jgi:hypothetical protein
VRLWFHGSAELVVWVHVWSFCVVDCVVSVGANVFLELLFSACCCDVDVIFELSSIRCLLLCDVESGKLRDNLQEHPVKCGFYSIFCRLNKHFTECPRNSQIQDK